MALPRISVLIPVYNGARYVRDAVESIIAQTYHDYELILIDDGSTDNTQSILADYARQDPRVMVVKNDCNRGLVYSLNRGLALASGEYIARMDADDISLPERFALQVRYMEQHPEVGVLGTNIAYIDADGHMTNGGRPKDAQPVSPNMIKWMLFWRCPIYHPTVMVRRDVFERAGLAYDPDYRHAEDRELWTRLIKHTVIASLGEVLLLYRLIPTRVSAVHKQEQRAMGHRIMRRELAAQLGTMSNDAALETLISVFSKHSENAHRDFGGASDLLFEVFRRFCEQPLSQSDREQIRLDVASRLISIADEAVQYSPVEALSLLWRLRFVLSRQLLSLVTAKRVLRVLFRSFGIRRFAKTGHIE